MSTHCHSLSFPASSSLFPCVCGCLWGEKSIGDRGKLKSLAARVSSRHEGLSLFCRAPPAVEGTFFLHLIQVKSLLLPLLSLSLSFSPVHTLAPFHILMPFKCHLFYMRYFVEMGNQEQSGLLSLWGDVGSRCITTPFLRLATAATCHFSGN